METVDWGKIRENYEKEMLGKLRNLPGHQEVSEDLLEFRSIISHELPETASPEIFERLIKVLLKGKKVNLEEIRNKYLKTELEKEKKLLNQNRYKFVQLKRLAREWIHKNLPEQRLRRMWKDHETWLPRRYTIYKAETSFEKIAADTLARFFLINN